ncbi:bifunctional molybdenum cofactor biosynthesis protein MoaC/MoaB [Nocardia sp. NPDC052254]|uniref:bifunctional molybdenum cofactor biosynthesis protein MoaC/MoaB n=1 Tax=Nocardia sp. NPDC052254 TaxID=3155681 RepID=UPI00343EDE05
MPHPDQGGLSHLDAEGRARMVDVSAKTETTRVAVAAGVLRTTPEVVALVRADDMPKADVLATARIAGIAGAKKTSELIPLCHQLALSSVHVRFDFTDDAITIEARAKTKGPTGVEMEALTAVAVAGLTLHDMVKAVDPAAVLDGVRLLTKDGGKHGHWERPGAGPRTAAQDTTEHLPGPARNPTSSPVVLHGHPHGHDLGDPRTSGHSGHAHGEEGSRSAVVVVASTGAAAGTRVDKTGPVLTDWLAGLGFSVRGPLVYADAEIASGLRDALDGGPGLVITTGGTGASPTDATPEATLAVLDRELPGVAESIRQRGTAAFPLAALSRGVAGLSGATVIVNLPGSPGGVRDGIAVLEPLLDHLLAQVAGGGRHE